MVAALVWAPWTLAAQELTPEQVAVAFVDAGFEVDAPINWTWAVPPHTTLRIYDRRDARVFMVVVYQDAATAERLSALPRLVPGFGPSTTRENVAVVQAGQADLEHWYRAESLRSVGMLGAVDDDPARSHGSNAAVAPDVLAALAMVFERSDL